MGWEILEANEESAIFATMLDTGQFLNSPAIAVAEAEVRIAFADIDPNDTEALYARALQVLDAIHEGKL